MPARRAVIRWAIRLLRREWRQQLLILALITVAVGATVVASTVATDTPAPVAGVLGTAQDAASFSGSPASVNAQIKNLENRWGRVDVIENESVQIPGTLNTFDLRAQDPRGPFGGPLLSLVSGQYPATASQIAVTSGVATDFNLRIGSSWTVDGVTRKVTGIVQNPESLLDEFALVIPGQVTSPDNVTVLFDAPGVSASSLSTSSMNVTTAQTVANTNEINPETISIAAAVLGMLLIALVGIGGFTVLAQRRLRAIGMLAAQGATQRHIRLVVRANGAATGIVGAVAGAVLGFLAWLAYRPQAENSAHHVMGVFQLPWTVIGISMALAIIATYFAASRPAKTIARVPVVAALAGRPPAPRKTRHLAIPIGLCFLVGAFLLLGAAGATSGGGGGKSNQTLELAVGFIALAVAIVLLAPALLSVVAAAGKRSPIAIRLALRDLARYRARSGPALAAISLSTLIAVIICVASAARFGNVLDYAGPNLTSSQLIVYAPGDADGCSSGPNGQPTDGADRRRAEGREGHRRRARHDQHDHAGADQREPDPRRDRALLVRPDLRGDAAAAERVRHQAVAGQPRRRHPHDAAGPVDDEPDAAHLRQPGRRQGPSAPGHRRERAQRPTRGPARREAASPTRRSRRSASSRPARPRRTRWSPSTRSPHCTCKNRSATAGWLIQVPNGLTAAQITDAQRIAAAGRDARRDPQQHPVAGADHRRGHAVRDRARDRHPRPERRPGPQRGGP